MSFKIVYTRVCHACSSEVPSGSPCDSCGGTKFDFVYKIKLIKVKNNKLNILRMKSKQEDLFN